MSKINPAFSPRDVAPFSGGAVKQLASTFRVLSADMVDAANSGHPGLPLGMATITAELTANFMRFNPRNPNWLGRDRFILSAGHGSALLYSMLHVAGYEDFSLAQLRRFRQLGSLTPGHPEYGHGIETTTGPLGQGIANAVGMAIAAKWLHNQFPELPHELMPRFWVIAGDGCLMEGVAQEAMALAGHLRLNNLIVLFDNNNITIDGRAGMVRTENFSERYGAVGWKVFNQSRYGDHTQVVDALQLAGRNAESGADTGSAPLLIACSTLIGDGAPTKADSPKVHGAPLGAEEVNAMKHALGWPQEPFVVPDSTQALTAQFIQRGAALEQQWEAVLHQRDTQLDLEKGTTCEQWRKLTSHAIDAEQLDAMLATAQADFAQAKPAKATRETSMDVIGHVLNTVPNILGGSADLTASNKSRAKGQHELFACNSDQEIVESGTYINYGVREHAMAAALNGIHLFGLRAYGATFLVFSDYCRPSIRLSALMQLGVIYVFTHDSIGVGEDGPTHQPVEQIAALRGIPGLQVIRPADAAEVAEAWHIAISDTTRPTALILSRQGVPYLRDPDKGGEGNRSMAGGYVVWSDMHGDSCDITLIATGSEVGLAIATAKLLASQSDSPLSLEVVSMPCRERFLAQPDTARDAVIRGARAAVIEASRDDSWWGLLMKQGYSRENAVVFGMDGFGASAPGDVVYDHFGLTAEHLAERLAHQ